MNYGGHFDISCKLDRLSELNKKLNSPNFWNSSDKDDVLKEIDDIKLLTKDINKLKDDINNNIELLEFDDNSLIDEIIDNSIVIKKELDKLSILLLLNKEFDKNNAIITVHSGAGGTEACDFANMLYRMYMRYIDKSGYKTLLLDIQDGDEAGIKSVTFKVIGKYAYGYLKGEKGVHRLVRLSPFDSNHRRHTSFASVDIIPEIDKTINIDINPSDLKIDVYRSSGKGGQGVNTTDSAVRITHLPTKIVVTCQNERSQIQNKEEALRILRTKLYLLEKEKLDQKLNNIEGNLSNIEFGQQIRSYVMHPYSLVKDHRTNYETSNVNKVLDGDLGEFINSYLKNNTN